MPRFLLDENVPLALREALKKRGFQVRLTIEDLGPGVRNGNIVNLAKQADAVLSLQQPPKTYSYLCS